MKKNFLKIAIASVLSFSLLFTGCASSTPATAPAESEDQQQQEAPANNQSEAPASGDVVELTMGSWRTDDVTQMTAFLGEFTSKYPNIKILFQPTNPPDYNATLRLQLESGTGPDLMYARSYATGRELYEAGYFGDCSDVPGINENISDANRAPWESTDGKNFAVPFAAVSHGVYYNKDIFNQYGLSVPTTWEEFIAVCQTLKDNGVTPLANGVADEWDILETFFLGMLPNYIGGPEQREKYEKGELKVNDEKFVQAYSDIAMVKPFLPDGFEAVTYNDSQVMFNTQSAAMFIDGSWTLSVYDGASFEWGVFAVPARKGGTTAICFHPDVAISMNAASKYPEEAKTFLAWLCSEEGTQAAGKYLPTGIFPISNFTVTLENPQANEFLALNAGKATDARFVWPALMDLYAPMNQAVINVLKGTATPQEAADSVAAVLE